MQDTILKSFLFVPGDSDKKMIRGHDSGASALILDLEDSVLPDRAEVARSMVLNFLQAHRDRSKQQIWVRINPLNTANALPDLSAILAGGPDGIMLPKVESAEDVVLLDHYLTALEHREGVAQGRVRIIPVVTEKPAAMFELKSYKGASRRAGFTGKIAIHPDQINTINAGFSPDEVEVTHAQAVVKAFENAHGAGTAQLDGKMLDKPHLTQVLRLLSAAQALSS